MSRITRFNGSMRRMGLYFVVGLAGATGCRSAGRPTMGGPSEPRVITPYRETSRLNAPPVIDGRIRHLANRLAPRNGPFPLQNLNGTVSYLTVTIDKFGNPQHLIFRAFESQSPRELGAPILSFKVPMSSFSMELESVRALVQRLRAVVRENADAREFRAQMEELQSRLESERAARSGYQVILASAIE